jgi:sirohydrochlorin cobaltochelatase
MKQLSPDTQVTCAYLELTEPDLPTTVAGLVQTGVNAIRIVPMFLGVGRHAREDLPLLLQDLIVQHPGVTFDLRNAIGEEPEMIRAMAAIALKSNP